MHYFYSKDRNSIVYLHQILREIKKHGGDISNIKSKFAKTKLKYYFNKYKLLKDAGYFKDDNFKKNVNYNIDFFKKSIKNCRHLTFEVTEDCNLKCTYCGYGDLYDNKKKERKHTLSLDKAKTLIAFLVKIWNEADNNNLNKEIRLSFYGGEPLLNFKIIKGIVDYTKQIKLNFNEFVYGMTTNAVLLDKYMDYLKENNFIIGISLDGDKKNNSYRVFKNGQPSYGKVEENIFKLKTKYPIYFKRKIKFLSVIQNRNSIENIFNYFKKYNKRSNVLSLNTNGLNKKQYENFKKIFVNTKNNISKKKASIILKDDSLFKLPIGESITNFLSTSLDDFFNNKKNILSKDERRINYTGTCIPLGTKIFLNAEGNIYPCNLTYFIQPIGKVDNIVKIEFTNINKKINHYLGKLSSQCKTCYLSTKCPTCILLIELEKNDYICPNYKNEKKYYNNLLDIMEFLEENPGLYKNYAENLY